MVYGCSIDHAISLPGRTRQPFMSIILNILSGEFFKNKYFVLELCMFNFDMDLRVLMRSFK